MQLLHELKMTHSQNEMNLLVHVYFYVYLLMVVVVSLFSISAINYLERLVSEMTRDRSSGTLNSTHSLTTLY